MSRKVRYEIRPACQTNRPAVFQVCFASGQPITQFDTVDEAIAAVKKYEQEDAIYVSPFDAVRARREMCR